MGEGHGTKGVAVWGRSKAAVCECMFVVGHASWSLYSHVYYLYVCMYIRIA